MDVVGSAVALSREGVAGEVELGAAGEADRRRRGFGYKNAVAANIMDLAVDDAGRAALRNLDAGLADVVDANAGLLFVLPRILIVRVIGELRLKAADGLVSADQHDAAALRADAAVVVAGAIGLVAKAAAGALA